MTSNGAENKFVDKKIGIWNPAVQTNISRHRCNRLFQNAACQNQENREMLLDYLENNTVLNSWNTFHTKLMYCEILDTLKSFLKSRY